jgi:uncharacterized protein YaaR (DUF327 family)
MFTTPLLSNERGAHHKKHIFSIFARVPFHGNVFTETLPSNKLFRFSGVISQYILDTVKKSVRNFARTPNFAYSRIVATKC